MKSSRSLEFDLSKVDQVQAFANLVAALNLSGVPFSLRQEQAIASLPTATSPAYI